MTAIRIPFIRCLGCGRHFRYTLARCPYCGLPAVARDGDNRGVVMGPELKDQI